MYVNNASFYNLEEYNKLRDRLFSQPHADQAGHSGEARFARDKNPVPAGNKPEPRHLHNMHPAQDRAQVPATNNPMPQKMPRAREKEQVPVNNNPKPQDLQKIPSARERAQVPVNNNPKPQDLQKIPSASEKAQVPANNNPKPQDLQQIPSGDELARRFRAGGVLNWKDPNPLNRLPPIPAKALEERNKNMGAIYNMVLQARQIGTSMPLMKSKSQSQPTWSPEQEKILDRWKKGAVGSENRVKAADILTQFKKKGKTKLDLSNLALKNLPPLMFEINIKDLDISENSLQSISPNIGKLTGLSKLNISGNGLESLPVEIGDLRDLKHLDLSHNQLADTFPKTFKRLQKLETLNLDHNDFIDVPIEIAKLNKLSTFSISNNNLTQAPDIMNRMQGLLHLNMANNRIEKVSSVWDLLLSRLKTLNLSGNIILELPFKEVPKALKTLNLSDNPICDLPKTFGAIMWAENGALKTTSRSRGNMRIIVDRTFVKAGLHDQGRLELRDENDLLELPDALRPPPRGVSVDDSDASEVDPADWGVPPLPPGGVEGFSVVEEPVYDRFGRKDIMPKNLEQVRKNIQDKIERIGNWIQNDVDASGPGTE